MVLVDLRQMGRMLEATRITQVHVSAGARAGTDLDNKLDITIHVVALA
jgi:hypothetical protein